MADSPNKPELPDIPHPFRHSIALQQAAQALGCLRRILLTADSRDHCNSMASCLDHPWRILSRDTTDGNDRQGDLFDDLFQEVKPARWACIFFGGREVD